ncbi:hypothetical protein DBV15_00016 [Temnothorax longispinosus]|uniref:Uncharacterized protein n=1 Tax=Temnothorax longispinosus TaxID=300112 RepID=A0A4S2KDZ8_9HYME|nr:hypothetical protein DBV15_00016 [Temnothorax longispinosus]
MLVSVHIRGAINKPLLKFVTGSYCFFVFLKTSSRLLGCAASLDALSYASASQRTIVEKRRRTGRQHVGGRKVNSQGKAVARGWSGRGVSRRKDRASYEIRLSYPPTPTTARRSWRRRQPPNADTMVDSCCRLRCFLRVAFLRRAALSASGQLRSFFVAETRKIYPQRGDRRAPFASTS